MTKWQFQKTDSNCGKHPSASLFLYPSSESRGKGSYAPITPALQSQYPKDYKH